MKSTRNRLVLTVAGAICITILSAALGLSDTAQARYFETTYGETGEKLYYVEAQSECAQFLGTNRNDLDQGGIHNKKTNVWCLTNPTLVQKELDGEENIPEPVCREVTITTGTVVTEGNTGDYDVRYHTVYCDKSPGCSNYKNAHPDTKFDKYTCYINKDRVDEIILNGGPNAYSGVPPAEILFESGSDGYHAEGFGHIYYNAWPKDHCTLMPHDYQFTFADALKEHGVDMVEYYQCDNNYVCWTYIDMTNSVNYAHCEIRVDGLTADDPDQILRDAIANEGGGRIPVTCETELITMSMMCTANDLISQFIDYLISLVVGSMEWRVL
jgi:hypothetical protein